jgi:hypothetical protein
MAQRSVVVQFLNNTNQTLSLSNSGLEGGIWSNNGTAVPPQQIGPQSSANWESESNGTGTGTQGFASYTIGGNASQVVTMTWDDPFAGSNAYGGTCPGGYQIPYSGGSGDNATVAFTLLQS